MSLEPSALTADRPVLVWGWDFSAGAAHPMSDIDPSRRYSATADFHWLHLNLADQRTRRWLSTCAPLPQAVRDLLLSAEVAQRTAAEDGVVGFVLQDVERDFDDGETRVGVLRFALAPRLMITARHHPVRSADIVRARIAQGAPVADAAAALDLLLAAMAETLRFTVEEIDAAVQAVEDDLLRGARVPDARAFVILRSLMVRLHRLFHGARIVLHQLDGMTGVSPALAAVAEKAADRLAGLDGELLSIQAQLRLLREEMDLQANQRTNQNLYILSILTALMMPATLVTGIFGMNTGGFPWAMAPYGTLAATSLAVGSAVAVYLMLRRMGFFRR